MRSAEVYGNGVGIWDYRRQFTLTPEEVSSLLRILEKAGFTSFEEIYGGKEEKDSSIRVTCRVVLSLAGQTKQVAQLAKGEQSPELKRLADELLAACEKPGQAGTAAADLTDGLAKVSRGELAPETFHVLLHRKPEKSRDGGFLLRLSGLRATNRGYDEAGFLDPVGLSLSPAEVAELAGELASLRLAQLPINLWAQDYTDLSVDVLNYKKSVQARQFAQMTPTTHGEHQADFERIYDALYQLHLRVQSEGEPGDED